MSAMSNAHVPTHHKKKIIITKNKNKNSQILGHLFHRVTSLTLIG